MLGLLATRFILRRRLHQATAVLAEILLAHGCEDERLVITLGYRQTLCPLDPDPIAIIRDDQHRMLDFDTTTRLALGRAIERYVTRERVPRLSVISMLRSTRTGPVIASYSSGVRRTGNSTSILAQNLLDALSGRYLPA